MNGGLDRRVGLVSGFEPSASGEFVVALDEQAHLAVDDLVCVESAVPRSSIAWTLLPRPQGA